VQNAGRKIYAKHFLIIVSQAAGGASRLGVTITRKVEPRSTRRNLLRRRIREVFRTERHRLKGCWDLVVIARKDSPLCDLAEIRRQIIGTLRRNNLISDDAGGERA
jgi:ribonuclease P protein component